MNEKIKQLTELKELIKQAQAQGKKVVFANGCFDLLHGGHISYLEDSKNQGDILVVGVNSDQSIRGIKGQGRPVMPQQERLEILSFIECVDYLILFDEATCDKLLRALRPDIHSKGTDYTPDSVPERQTARELGIATYIAGEPKENATRNIIELIVERYGSKKSG